MKIRKATVVLPKAPRKVPANPKLGSSPRASRVIRLGQSMEMVIHMISDPRKTPSTPRASVDSPRSGQEPGRRHNE